MKARRFDWHGVVFWGSLGTALILMGLSTIRKDHRIPTIFSEEGRRIVIKYHRTHTPELAKWLGIDK